VPGESVENDAGRSAITGDELDDVPT